MARDTEMDAFLGKLPQKVVVITRPDDNKDNRDIIYQEVTVTSQGKGMGAIWWRPGEVVTGKRKGEPFAFETHEELARRIMERAQKVVAYYRLAAITEERDPLNPEAEDQPFWQVILYYEGGKTVEAAHLLEEEPGRLPGLSTLIRMACKREDLSLLDGNAADALYMEIRLKPGTDNSEGSKEKFGVDLVKNKAKVTLKGDHGEKLSVSHQNDEIEVFREILPWRQEIKDNFDFPQDPKPETYTLYDLRVTTAAGKEHRTRNIYDAPHLAKDWAYFMDVARTLFPLTIYAVLFQEKSYSRRAPRQGDVALCQVELADGNKAYFCSDTDNIYPEDGVRVPGPEAGTDQEGRVTQVFYANPADSPVPLPEVKTILEIVETSRDPLGPDPLPEWTPQRDEME